jgi:hypothetical protein
MKTKHTKGEWHITPNGEYVGTLGQGKTGVCMILMKGREEGQANAKLIASAPNLLHALQMLINDIERNDGDAINRATLVNEAKQVVDKATS